MPIIKGTLHTDGRNCSSIMVPHFN